MLEFLEGFTIPFLSHRSSLFLLISFVLLLFVLSVTFVEKFLLKFELFPSSIKIEPEFSRKYHPDPNSCLVLLERHLIQLIGRKFPFAFCVQHDSLILSNPTHTVRGSFESLFQCVFVSLGNNWARNRC